MWSHLKQHTPASVTAAGKHKVRLQKFVDECDKKKKRYLILKVPKTKQAWAAFFSSSQVLDERIQSFTDM